MELQHEADPDGRDAADAPPARSARAARMHVPLPAVLVGIGVLASSGTAGAAIARDDAYSIPKNATLGNVFVTANDTIASNVFTVLLSSTPSHGAAAIQPGTGLLKYVPNPGFQGFDVFGYRLQDQQGNSFAQVSIYIGQPAVIPALGTGALAGLAALLALAGLGARRK